MNIKLLATAIVLWSVIIVVVAPSALATTDANAQAVVEIHKDDNRDDIDDDAIYYASEQYQTAKKANQFIATAYGRE